MLSTHFTDCFFTTYEQLLGIHGVNALLNLSGIRDRPEQMTIDQISTFIRASFEMRSSRQSILNLHRWAGREFAKCYNHFISDVNDIPALLRPLADAVVINQDVIIEACPFCADTHHAQFRKTTRIVMCSFAEGWLTTALQEEYSVREIECLAKGGRACVFRLERKR